MSTEEYLFPLNVMIVTAGCVSDRTLAYTFTTRRTRCRSSTLGARFSHSDEVLKRRGLFFDGVVFGFCRRDVPRSRRRLGVVVFAVTRSNLPRWTSPSIERIRVCIFVATKMTRWWSSLGFLSSLYILVRSFGRCRVNLSRRIGRKDGGFLFPRRSPTAFW